MRPRHRSAVLAAAASGAVLAFAPEAIAAQAGDDNALAAASDAFGTSVGRESIGLYSAMDVRGFSPAAAGNIRIEGLYIDAIGLPNARLAAESSIKVGVSAQGYPFTAPTGVADYRLRLPGRTARGSGVLGASHYGNYNVELNLEAPLSDTLSVGAGGVASDDNKIWWGGEAVHLTGAVVARWRPSPGLEIIPFASYFAHTDEVTQPRFVVGGPALPPEFQRGVYLGQDWTRWTWEDTNTGLIARGVAGGWRLSGGVFRSVRKRNLNYSDQYLGVTPDGLATNHRIIASPGIYSGSTSGELRASRPFTTGEFNHTLHLSLRARDQKRLYGGGSSVDFGPTAITDRLVLPQPAFALGAQTRDRIRQGWAGIGYQGAWGDKGEVALSLQKTDYSKRTAPPTGAAQETKASPWLYSASAAVRPLPRLVVYAGLSRGLEESAAAPEVALNRDEAPPAIITRQFDGGISLELGRGMRLIAGGFNIEKPYFNLDSGRVYRRLGDIRTRGVELSVAGSPVPGLTVLAGAILMKARVEGEAATLGLVGRRPVGSTGHVVLMSADYRLPRWSALSVDAGVELTGPRVGNAADTLETPATGIVNVGFRYRFRIAGHASVLRAQIANLFDAYGWEVQASNSFAYDRAREATVRLTTEF